MCGMITVCLLTNECNHVHQAMDRFCWGQEHGVAVDRDGADPQADGDCQHGSPVEDPVEG